MSLICLMCCSCAAKYQPINFNYLPYVTGKKNRAIEVGFIHNVLAEAGNKRYQERAQKKRISILALKLSNHTKERVNVWEQVVFFAGDTILKPLGMRSTVRKIKQKGFGYIPFLLIPSINLTTVNTTNNTVTVTTISLSGIGPGIFIYNIIKLSRANRRFYEDMNRYHMNGLWLDPGETRYALLSIDADVMKRETEDLIEITAKLRRKIVE